MDGKHVNYAVGFFSAYLLSWGIFSVISLVVGSTVMYFLEVPGLVHLIPVVVGWSMGLAGGYLGFRLFTQQENAWLWAGRLFALLLALNVLSIILSIGVPLQELVQSLLALPINGYGAYFFLYDTNAKSIKKQEGVDIPRTFVYALMAVIVTLRSATLYVAASGLFRITL